MFDRNVTCSCFPALLAGRLSPQANRGDQLDFSHARIALETSSPERGERSSFVRGKRLHRQLPDELRRLRIR